jgi:2',3'-cyclic-nucleotide 2'-phosphodiesterase (5'-nucleotidase family)
VLDAGNSLTGDRPPASTTQGASSVEAMNMMGYDAMALGAGDLKLGVTTVVTRMHEAKFAFISANAVVSATGALVAPAFITREVSGRRIAIVGLTGTWDKAPLPDAEILDPVETARKVVPEAAKQSDFVIMLSNAGNPTDVAIADSVPGIGFIISGGPFQSFGQSQLSPKSGTLLGHADYPAAGHSGRIVGKAVLGIDADGVRASYTWSAISLGPDIADDPQMAHWRALH